MDHNELFHYMVLSGWEDKNESEKCLDVLDILTFYILIYILLEIEENCKDMLKMKE